MATVRTSEPAPRDDSAAAGLDTGTLARELRATLHGSASVRVVDVEQDSRRVRPGALFVGLRGGHADGLAFAARAIGAGASAVLCEAGRAGELAGLGVPVLEVTEPREALARAAARVHGDPTRALRVVGLTGTNGKTTTAHLVEAGLAACGVLTGIVGTLGHRLGGEPLGSGHTSPEADELQRIAATLRARGASHLVMEVSSIALASSRVSEVAFDVAAFTNLTQDHLDFHGSMAAYAAAKDRLFLDHRPRAAVIDVDDAHGAGLAPRARAAGVDVLTVSTRRDALADLRPASLRSSASGTRLVLTDGLVVDSPLVGAHNASNLLVAIGVARALGLGEAAVAGIAAMRTVAGRLERCDVEGSDDVVAVVDYAHTPDALARVLASLRGLTEGRLWCVFGCGGDRDPGKRAPMGEAVAAGADVAIVTNDNPRGEEPQAIADAVLAGLARAGASARTIVELDRARAIAHAVRAAAPGDVVLVAGKGHEPYQIVGAVTHDFDDRTHVRAALERRRAARRAG